MSKPITLSKPASLAVSTMPTTPPAGPESSASLPWKRSAAVSPPDDIMNISRRRLGLHRFGFRCRALSRHLAHIAGQDRRQIGVDHRRIAAADQLDQRRYLVADRDLGEADVAAQAGHDLLVRRELPGMHEDDGDCVYAVGLGLLDRRLDAGEVERRLDRSIRPHPLVDLDHALVELLGQHDLLGEDLRPRLVGDSQRVAEAR